MQTIRLRPADDADFEFFFRLHRQTLGPYVEQVWGWVDENQRAYLQRTIDVDATQVVVVDGVDVGRLNVGHLADDVYLGLIEIAPDHQKRGVGARILRSILDCAFADGKGVQLHVLDVNAGAYRLYRRLGFDEVGREGAAPAMRIRMRANPAGADQVHQGIAGPWHLRSATVGDRVFIVEMARQASVIEDWPLPDADSEDVHDLLPSNDDTVLVAADVLGRPVAAAWTFHSDPPLIIDEGGASVPEVCIAVVPESRGRGAGGALLDELVRRCAPRHVALCLNVHQRNTNARKLYARKGFQEEGQGRGSLGVAMRKELRASILEIRGRSDPLRSSGL